MVEQTERRTGTLHDHNGGEFKGLFECGKLSAHEVRTMRPAAVEAERTLRAAAAGGGGGEVGGGEEGLSSSASLFLFPPLPFYKVYA